MLAERPTKQCLLRLQREYRALMKDPSPLFSAAPFPDNILRWCIVFNGPPDTPYHDGRYLCEMTFPPNYPFEPPTVVMQTPNGRFRVGVPICLSNNSFHPENWSPLWSLSTIVTGLVSFFVSEEPTYRSISSSPRTREFLRSDSRRFCVEVLGADYRKVLLTEYEADKKILENQRQQASRQTPQQRDSQMPVGVLGRAAVTVLLLVAAALIFTHLLGVG